MNWHKPHSKQKKKKNKFDKKSGIKLNKLLSLLKQRRRSNHCCEKGKEKNPIDDASLFTRPEIGDKLFKEPANYNDLLVLGRFEGKNDFMITNGFYETTMYSLNALKEKGVGEKDSHIYPILYNFRHYLELILKQIIRYFRLTNNEVSDDEIGYKAEHSLKKLWEIVKPYLRQVEDIDDDETKAFEALINELNDIDSNSFAFRYNCEGGKTMRDKIVLTFPERIDISLSNLEEVMRKMHFYIEGISEVAHRSYEDSREIN